VSSFATCARRTPASPAGTPTTSRAGCAVAPCTSRHGAALPALDGVRAAGSPLAAAGELAHALLRAAHGVERPPVGEAAKLDLRAHEAVLTLTSELAEWETLASALSREEVVSALEGAALRSASPGEPGRVAVLDLARARTRRPEILFLLGLEEGSLPRKADVSPFLGDDERRELEGRSRRARLPERGALARDRYLFYTACTRPSRRLYLVREAASDEGTPGEASPFWHEVRALVETDDAERWTRRRPLSALVWPLERAPTERERLRATAALAAAEPEAARAIARANGWERRLERATGASRRPTRLTHPQVLAELRERKSFGVTELETFAECSSMWLLERVVDPKSIDGEVDARLRGSIAHSALQRFFTGLPKRVGTERVSAERLDESLDFMHECLDEAIGSGLRLDATELARRELEHGLRRDLEGFVRQEAASPSPLVPRRFEVSFGSERSAPELQRGLQLGDFTLSGKIDRIDVDPFSARAIVQDYKSGKTAHSAAKIDSELRLQVPLYMLVLRDLVGVEPLGGVYRALGGERPARGLLRAEARADGVPGFQRNDYLDDDEFWAQIERARTHAETFVGRIRGGDIVHDPKGGGACPSWCRLAALCRIEHV